jgi:hypothetical protein
MIILSYTTKASTTSQPPLVPPVPPTGKQVQKLVDTLIGQIHNNHRALGFHFGVLYWPLKPTERPKCQLPDAYAFTTQLRVPENSLTKAYTCIFAIKMSVPPFPGV